MQCSSAVHPKPGSRSIPIDARGLSLQNDDIVAIVRRRGRVEEMRVRIGALLNLRYIVRGQDELAEPKHWIV